MTSIPPAALPAAIHHCKVCNQAVIPFYSTDFSDGGPAEYKATIQPCGVDVHYMQCTSCGFIFTNFFDHWTSAQFSMHVYNEDYTLIDPAYTEERPQACAALLDQLFTTRPSSMLDYGSGSGALKQFLTARGWQNVVSYDPFSDPVAITKKAALITAFEVVEHDMNPKQLFQQLATHLEEDGILFFSTTIFSPYNYWYIAPRAGHCSIHSQGSLLYLAKMLNFNIATDHGDIHIMWQGEHTLDHLPALKSYFMPSYAPDASSAFSQAYYFLPGNRHRTGEFPNKITSLRNKLPKLFYSFFDQIWRLFTVCLIPFYCYTSHPQWKVIRRHSLQQFYWAGPENCLIFYTAPRRSTAAIDSWECTISLHVIQNAKQLLDAKIWIGSTLLSTTQIYSNCDTFIHFVVKDMHLRQQEVTAIYVRFYYAGTENELVCLHAYDNLYFLAAVFGFSALPSQ